VLGRDLLDAGSSRIPSSNAQISPRGTNPHVSVSAEVTFVPLFRTTS
jgi:hypothetical protein